MEKLVNKITQAIERSSDSRYRIAKGSGVSESAISRFMSGERGLGIDSAGKLADYLGLQITIKQKTRKKGENKMTQKSKVVYAEIREEVSKMGGTMVSRPLAPGSVWTITLWGKSAEVRASDHSINDLDRCYEPPAGVPNPMSWDDWPVDGPYKLKPNANWQLVDIVRNGSSQL